MRMVEPPTWAMSWPSLEVARAFLDQMSAEDAERLEQVILEVGQKTGTALTAISAKPTPCGDSCAIWSGSPPEHSRVAGYMTV
jgi:hypothetical protein